MKKPEAPPGQVFWLYVLMYGVLRFGMEILRGDDRAIVRAASAASKAADYLLAFRPDADEPVEVPKAADHLHANDRQSMCVG